MEKAKIDGFTLASVVIKKTKADFTASYMDQYQTLKKGENMQTLASKYSQDTPVVKTDKGIYEVKQDSQSQRQHRFKEKKWQTTKWYRLI